MLTITVKNDKVWAIVYLEEMDQKVKLRLVEVRLPLMADARGIANAKEMVESTERIFALYGYRLPKGGCTCGCVRNRGFSCVLNQEGIDLKLIGFTAVEGTLAHHSENINQVLARIVRAFSRQEATSTTIQEGEN